MRSCFSLALFLCTGCIFSPENQTVVDSMDGIIVEGVVPASAGTVDLYVATVPTPNASNPDDWEAAGSTSAATNSFGLADIDWFPWVHLISLDDTHWFSTPGGFKAHLRADWGGYDLFSIEDLGCLGLAQDIDDLLACTTGHVLELRSPEFCDLPTPMSCPLPSGPPPGHGDLSCVSFNDPNHIGSVSQCLVDGRGERLQCVSSFCDDDTLYQPQCNAQTGEFTHWLPMQCGTHRDCAGVVGSANGAGTLLGNSCGPA